VVLLPLTDKDLLNRSHLLYQVLEINGYKVYLEFVKMLHTPAEYPKQLRHFPPKVTMLIEGNYNSLEYSPDDATESIPTYRLAKAVTQRRPIPGARRNDEYQHWGFEQRKTVTKQR
jgi:hypothetical protein